MRLLFGAPWFVVSRAVGSAALLYPVAPGIERGYDAITPRRLHRGAPSKTKHPEKGGYSMIPAPFRPFISLASTLVCALIANAAQAQAPAAPPSWQQGRNAEQEKSPLHPFAIDVTGKSAKQVPVDKLKVPDRFKVDVCVDGLPGARSIALGRHGTR